MTCDIFIFDASKSFSAIDAQQNDPSLLFYHGKNISNSEKFRAIGLFQALKTFLSTAANSTKEAFQSSCSSRFTLFTTSKSLNVSYSISGNLFIAVKYTKISSSLYDDFSQDFIQQLKFNVKRIVGIFQTLNGNLADLIQTETKASLEKRFRNWADLVFDDNVEAALTGFFGHFKVPNFLPVTRNLVEKVQISVNNFLSKEIEVHDILLFSSESCRDQASCIYAGNAISRLSIENVYFTVQTLSSCHNRNVRKAIKFSLGSFLGISSDDEAINEYTRFRGQGSKASHTNCLQKRCLNLFFESSGPQRQAFVSNLIHLDQLAFLVIYNFHQENGLEEFKKLSAKVTKFIQALRLLLPTSKSDFWIPKNDLFYYYIYDEINEREFRSIPSTLLRIGNGSYKDIISRYIWRLSSSRNDQISDKIKLKNGSWIIFYKTSARYTILYRTYDNLRKAHKTTDISSYESINDIGRIARQFIHRTRIQDHRAWDIW